MVYWSIYVFGKKWRINYCQNIGRRCVFTLHGSNRQVFKVWMFAVSINNEELAQYYKLSDF